MTPDIEKQIADLRDEVEALKRKLEWTWSVGICAFIWLSIFCR